MAFGKSFNGSTGTPPATSGQQAGAPANPNPGARPGNPFGDFESEDARGSGAPDGVAPWTPDERKERAEGKGDRDNPRMRKGTHVAWVDEIVNWPGRGVRVKWMNTDYKVLDHEQQCPDGIVKLGDDSVHRWTKNLLDVYEGLGRPDRDGTVWTRRNDERGQQYRVPPWDKFWWVVANTSRGPVLAPIAFELNVEVNKAGFPYIVSARPMGGPRLARLPTTLPRDLAAHYKLPHEHDAIVLKTGAYAGTSIPVARLQHKDDRLWVGGTDLESIQPLMRVARGA